VNKSPNVFVELRDATRFSEARGLWPAMRTFNSPPPRPSRAVKRLYFRLVDPDDVEVHQHWVSGGPTA
jgi:hypothetical protein